MQKIQNTDTASLEAAIGHSFSDKNILLEALTHSSFANELKARKKYISCNERLEFLGDSVLSLVASELLYEKFKELPEGELTKRRAMLVQSSALASYAREINLGEYLYLGNGEEMSNGRDRQSILENAFEALVAAVYLDAGKDGLDAARAMLTPFIKKELDGMIDLVHFDSKTELQQLIQQAEGDFLEYAVVGESGPDHNKTFEVEARLNSNVIGRGRGRSKREAEQNAAHEALKLFGV